MIAYRKRSLPVDEELIKRFEYHVHAKIEMYYCDSAIHRKYSVDVKEDDDILDFSDYEIAEVVEKCMEEDIEAVQKRRTP